MARPGDQGKLRARDGGLEQPRPVQRQHVAFRAFDQQRRAGDLFDLLGQLLLHLFDIDPAVALAEIGVVLPGPLAARQLLEVVDHGVLADDLQGTPGVELVNDRRRLVQGIELAEILHEVTDILHALVFDPGADINHDQGFDPVRIVGRKRQRVGPAHRHAGQKKAVQAERGGKPLDILDHAAARVVFVGRPVGVAVAALVKGHDVKVGGHGGGEQVPGMAGLADSVEENQRGVGGLAPVQVVKFQSVGFDITIG